MYSLIHINNTYNRAGSDGYSMEVTCGSIKDECSHLELCKLFVLLDFLQSFLRLLAVLDEGEVLLLQLGKDLHQLLRVTEVQLNLLTYTDTHTHMQ